jgi:hypothetical protein
MISNGEEGLPPERIGEIVRTAMTVARPKTRYTVTPNPLQNLLALTLPKRVVGGVIARRLALKPTRAMRRFPSRQTGLPPPSD